MGILVLIAGMFFSQVSVWADQVVRQAQITTMNGKVEWVKAGTTDWQAASLDQQLGAGDKIRTGESSDAVLTLDEGSKINVAANSEFAVQTLIKDSKTEQLQSVLALMKGRMQANVTSLKPGSSFEVETPVMVAAVRGTVFNININPDGSVNATSVEDTVELIRQGQNKFVIKLENGDEAQVQVELATGDVRITSVKGDFDVTGPNGEVLHLKEGQSIVLRGGAATFIPFSLEVAQPPAGDSLGEPIVAAEENDTPSDSLGESPSGS